MLEKVRDILEEYTDIPKEEIGVESAFAEDLGLSSLDLIDIMVAFENEFDIEIPEQKLVEFITVGDVVDTLVILIADSGELT